MCQGGRARQVQWGWLRNRRLRGCVDSVGQQYDVVSLEEVRCREGGVQKPPNCSRRRRSGIHTPGDGAPELWKDEEGVAKSAAADGGQHLIISGQHIDYSRTEKYTQAMTIHMSCVHA